MLFHSPSKIDYTIDEGTVTQVDTLRKVCRVRTLRSQNIDAVQWMSPTGGSGREGDRFTPQVGNRVVLSHGLGFPLIIGFLPKLQSTSNTHPLNIQSGTEIIDTGDYTSGMGSVLPDANSPIDDVSGDRVITTTGGAMIAALRAGSVLVRASKVSQIFMNKVTGLVRVVSRLWEHFTDVSSDVVYNLNNRVYRYTGYSYTFGNSKIENYQMHFMYGDVAAAETIKTAYASVTTAPAFSNVIYKEKVTGTGGAETMHRTLSLDGSEEVVVTGGGTHTKMSATNGQLTFTFNDQNTITVNNGVIQAHRSDGADITMNSSGITATFNSGQIEMNGSHIKLTYGGGVTEMNSSSVTTTFGGHYITVDAGGVGLG